MDVTAYDSAADGADDQKVFFDRLAGVVRAEALRAGMLRVVEFN